MAAAVFALAQGCCPRAPAASGADERSTPSRACVLYDKNESGWTMKRAVFASDLVGGTPGERDAYKAEHSRDTEAYDSVATCTAYARGVAGAWCECPRGPDRAFEDGRPKDLPVVWVDGAGSAP